MLLQYKLAIYIQCAYGSTNFVGGIAGKTPCILRPYPSKISNRGRKPARTSAYSPTPGGRRPPKKNRPKALEGPGRPPKSYMYSTKSKPHTVEGRYNMHTSSANAKCRRKQQLFYGLPDSGSDKFLGRCGSRQLEKPPPPPASAHIGKLFCRIKRTNLNIDPFGWTLPSRSK